MHLIKKTIILYIIIIFSNTAWSVEADSQSQELQKISRVWDGFVEALRIGDMHSAYIKLSKESRAALPYRDFCVDWHPISLKYNAVLANPKFSDFSIYGNIAAVRIGLQREFATKSQNFARIILENRDNTWWIVDDRVQFQAIADASIRGVLRDLVRESSILNTAFNTGTGSFADIKQELPRIFSAQRGRLALSNYTFELDLLRDGVLRALAKKPNLRCYEITAAGKISECKANAGTSKLTAEEVLANRNKAKKLQAQHQLRLNQERTAQNKPPEIHNSAKNNNLKIAPQIKTNLANLPAAPPEFPKDFTTLSKSATVKAAKKFKFIRDDDKFDLPELNNLNDLKTIKIKPNINHPENKHQASEKKSYLSDTHAMAGSDESVHITSVELESDMLLDELEAMLKEHNPNLE